MAARRTGSRLIKALGYASAAGVVGAGTLYIVYRPHDVPGLDAASVPPPTYNEGGFFKSPNFPREKTRAEHIADLKASAGSAFKQAGSKIAGALKGDQVQTETSDGEEYDLLVIGGGATGTGIALDAATRGLKVACVDRDDFAAGTSSKSTKLVHGGVRYLEKAVWELDLNQYNLVKEALRERRYFLDTAPHLSSWLPIMIPIQKWWQAPYFWAGTKFYDFLAGSENIESSYFMTRSKALDVFPMLKKDGLFGALVYYDGAHNDSRMNTSIAMTAALYGATMVNHVEVTSLEKDANGRLCGARVKDNIAAADGGKDEFTIKAKGVINATGPFTDGVRKLDDPSVQEIVAPSSGVHVILPGYYSPSNMGLLDPHTSDGRVIFFLPWQGNTIAGTTDAPCPILQNPVAGEQEIEWILSEVRNYLQPEINVRRGDVLAAWSGIRPLVRDPDKAKSEGLVRNHLVTTSPSGLITISGGKWTTYRQMAEEAVDEALKEFPIHTRPVPNPPLVSGVEGYHEDMVLDGTCKTHAVRLVGAHGYSKTLFINLIQHYGIETEVAKHLTTSYGDRAWKVAALCEPTEQRYPVRGKRISALYPYVDGEVRYAVRHEYAQSAVDVLARRTRLAFLNAQAALEALPQVIDLMSEELKWNQGRREKEWRDALRFLGSMGLPKGKLELSRADVEAGKVGKYVDEEYGMYARHDKPDETLESDSKFAPGRNPVMDPDSPANA
ncbi:mitochondrial glycerol-3-phosphate dehydrogenase [Friedmanniomyces endolithicus]|uniref:Glycerol-3-phosphate dehydrogenase n=1 Tax=Friedmanniomyces endolithicus TaxID=329885 RepID=A0AAN6KEM4_9PEZI|nr:mitochondrial glycerol-3-phosphate dehydrogenase [Friedmanniomyces endolithicus]KAK0787339.1 mitochondrial glycerol-3-phosphate dehydrogenase [Friedmanniomyces endolithicus]KAK0814382.1 mitochondrial glycerol-3-phosphate dehydrogenase [Friedmanniomyces endolithicus]KAK0853656.1 mitochondrial glycerol-3-phosphate dehydrogenase [Friedmanniomyces endolithicus]KAK0856011.1 mitochondrial glycerol-3-phosphate dehydrogenase [Friedmanniomyces endolithicus]